LGVDGLEPPRVFGGVSVVVDAAGGIAEIAYKGHHESRDGCLRVITKSKAALADWVMGE
jgi:hypothetical protein